MDLKTLQQTYALDKLVTDKCKTHYDEFHHLESEVKELWTTLMFNDLEAAAKELADVIIVATMLANRLNINIDKAIMDKTESNIQKGKLKR